MKRKGLALGVVLLATAGAAAAIAAGGHRGMGHHDGHGWHHGGGKLGGHHGGKGHRMMNLKQRDADGDGAVTLDEFLKPRADRFTELDANKDGALDAAELTAKMAQRAGHRQRMMMAELDANGDGEVSKDEFESSRHFGRGGRHGWGKDHRGHRGQGRNQRMGDDDAAAATPAPADAQAAAQSAAEADANAKAVPSERKRMSREERREQRFTRMDANGDGKLTAADIEARAGEHLDYAKRKKMHVLDKDKDGKVTVEEFTARAKQRFADLDLDGDGKISATDLPPRMAERWQSGGKR